MQRIDKLTKLVALFDQFHQSIAELEDPTARRLVANWVGIRQNFVDPLKAPRSALASGMEQGLRENPMLLQSMRSEARKRAVQTLADATLAHYPDFLIKEEERLAKIKARGSIRTEAEFYLIRDLVDRLEVAPAQEQEVQVLVDCWIALKADADKRTCQVP